MNRRELIKNVSVGAVGFVAVSAFGPPACSVSKDKAVRYTVLAIGYLNDILPILSQIGGDSVAALISKAIPLLEKLKKALEENDFPEAGNFFDTVTATLGQVATALLQLPESAKRDVIIGILTLVQITMRTVSLFIESEVPPANIPQAVRRVAQPNAILKAFEASRF